MAFSVSPSPSVTVREVDATATPQATSSFTAAIAGVFHWGPTNERVLVTSESELVSRFFKPSNFNAETFFVAADYLAHSNALYVTRVTNGAAKAASTNFVAKYEGALGNSIEVSAVTNATGFRQTVFAEGATTGSIAFGDTSVTFISTTDLIDTINVGDSLRIGNNSIGYQRIKVSSVIDGGVDEELNQLYIVNFNGKYTLSEVDLSKLKVEREWRHAGIVPTAPQPQSAHIVVSDKDGKITGTAGTVLEIYKNVSLIAGAKLEDGTNNYFETVIENGSKWIEIGGVLLTNSNKPTYQTLTSGADGDSESTSTIVGSVLAGYDLYNDAADVDVSFILGGKAIDASAPVVANHIISNVVGARKDCIAFISPRREDVVDPLNGNDKADKVLSFRSSLINSSYWFMDSGYKYRYDKYNDVYRWVPLNGDIAGLCAKVDPWESPAGYKRGNIKNVVKLAFNPNTTQRGLLYGSDVNPVISQPGQGIILFGDKTGLGAPSAFDRINVRRLFITIEKSIANVSASFLFDFNDEFTQSQFKNMVEPYLRDIQGRRGIIDFRVISDATVNTPDVIDRNEFRGHIFVKPARTISHIELSFIATRTGIEFEEIVGKVS